MMTEFNALWNSEHTLAVEDFIEDYEVRYKLIKEQKKNAAKEQMVDLQAYKLQPNKMQARCVSNFRKLLESNAYRDCESILFYYGSCRLLGWYLFIGIIF